MKEVRSLRDSIKQKKRDIIEVQDKISSEEFYRVSKQSTLNALRRKIEIERPVDEAAKVEQKLTKELEVQERELNDIKDAMNRLKNLKTQRAGGESAKLLGEIQDIKGMLSQEKRLP